MATVPQILERKVGEERECPDPGFLVIPASTTTYKGFLDWVMSGELPEKFRVTFISGEVILDMTEENIDTHAEVKAPVCQALLNLVTEQDFGKLYLDGVLIGNESAGVANNPDAVAFRWSSLETGRVRFIERKGQRRALEGSPDWVLEIVSDSSVGKDTKKLRNAYHRAGISEYWLIDARGETIEFQIFHDRKSGYVAASPQEGWLVSKVFRREFRLTRKRDRRGTWSYSLESRPMSGPKTQTRKKS